MKWRLYAVKTRKDDVNDDNRDKILARLVLALTELEMDGSHCGAGASVLWYCQKPYTEHVHMYSFLSR